MANQIQTSITETDSGVSIVIPARFNKRATTGIVANSLILVFYFASIFPSLLRSGESIVLIVLVNVFLISGLSGFFAYNLLTALWCYYGKETLVINQTSCLFSKTIFGLGPARRYAPVQVTAVSAVDPESPGGKPKNLLQSIGIGWGRISLACGDKTYFFGAALEEGQVREALDLIGRHVKL
jgi:hypothetical protein